MAIILPANTLAAGGFSVANSCRFNVADSQQLQISPTSSGNRKTWTLSIWVKRGKLETSNGQSLMTANGSGIDDYLRFSGGDDWLNWVTDSDPSVGGGTYSSQADYRDPSAWYHFVFRCDSTESTAGDRMRLYVNGVEVSSFRTATDMNEDEDTNTNSSAATHRIGGGTGRYFDGYLAEVVLLDGTSAAPTEFGEFDEDSPTIWKPIDVSGLSPGTNGFYLDFEDSSNLGNNAFGSGSGDLTATNLAAADQCLDSPTNNFCTLNPLDNYYAGGTFSEGNNTLVTPYSGYTFNTGTIGLSAGLWYWEEKIDSSSGYDMIGIASHPTTAADHSIGYYADSHAYRSDTGKTYTNTVSVGGDGTSYGDTYTTGDIIGVYLDLTANKIYFAKNGTVQNSGTGVSITAAASTTNGLYFPAVGDYHNSGVVTASMNFGNGQFAGTAVSSGNADDDGYGNFEYDPTAGTFDSASKKFYAICTKNLAEYG